MGKSRHTYNRYIIMLQDESCYIDVSFRSFWLVTRCNVNLAKSIWTLTAVVILKRGHETKNAPWYFFE